MQNDFLLKVKESYANRDLETLDSSAISGFCEINKNHSYSSVLMQHKKSDKKLVVRVNALDDGFCRRTYL